MKIQIVASLPYGNQKGITKFIGRIYNAVPWGGEIKVQEPEWPGGEMFLNKGEFQRVKSPRKKTLAPGRRVG